MMGWNEDSTQLYFLPRAWIESARRQAVSNKDNGTPIFLESSYDFKSTKGASGNGQNLAMEHQEPRNRDLQPHRINPFEIGNTLLFMVVLRKCASHRHLK